MNYLHQVNERSTMTDAVVIPNIFFRIDFEGRRVFSAKWARVPVVNSANTRWLESNLCQKFRNGDGLGLFSVHVEKLEE